MKTGVLGGTFDPPHAGHLRMARLAQAQLRLDRVLFVPCCQQPLKGTPPVASGFHRAAMVALALAGKDSWLLDVRELTRGGVSYTAETLEELAAAYPRDHFFLIVGGDSLRTFRQWHRYPDIIAAAELAVVPRGTTGSDLGELPQERVHTLRGRHLPVSSTQVRQRLAQGEPVLGLVPRAVAAYIQRQDLYGSGRPKAGRRID